MALSIERLRYYDGEFLRAFDWTAEQTYQIQMRRRLHLALGHWGIVEGLDIATDSEGATKTFAINPGVAIDPAGREMFVFTAYQLDDTLLTANLIKAANTYQLLLQYQLIPNTPPSAGYGQCNGGNQYTRWQESFAVLIKSNWTQPSPLPKATDPLSENAIQDGFAVPLANVVIGPDSSGSLVVQSFNTTNRRYYGTRTQFIAPPIRPSSTDLTKKETPLNPPTSIEMHSSAYVHDNLIVGPNFSLGASAPTPTNPGSVKVSGDIILQGKIYSPDTSGDYVNLASSIQSQAPQIVCPTTPFQFMVLANSTGTGTASLPAPVQPPNPLQPGAYTVAASAWLAGVTWADKTTVDNVFAANASPTVEYEVGVQVVTPTSGGGANVTFNYTVSPVACLGSPCSWVSAIAQLAIGYVVIFTPIPT